MAAEEDTPFNQYDQSTYILSEYLSQQEALGFAEHSLDLSMINPAFPLRPGDGRPYSHRRHYHAINRWSACFAIPGGFNVVDVCDVVAGHILTAEQGRSGEKYTLGNKNVTGEKLSKVCAEILDKKEKVIPRSAFLLEGGALVSQLVADHIIHSKPLLNLKGFEYTQFRIYGLQRRKKGTRVPNS